MLKHNYAWPSISLDCLAVTTTIAWILAYFGFLHFGCRFVDEVNATISLLHPIHCMKERKVHLVFDVTTIPAFLIVLGVLFLVLKPRRPKPKINWRLNLNLSKVWFGLECSVVPLTILWRYPSGELSEHCPLCTPNHIAFSCLYFYFLLLSKHTFL